MTETTYKFFFFFEVISNSFKSLKMLSMIIVDVYNMAYIIISQIDDIGHINFILLPFNRIKLKINYGKL